ncbi:MAG: spore maturation protein [Candidatus Gastranaerophilales bacterium]|nr:spore maturation protein [Candidatus Gastranaerophilales bacterium]
MHNIKAIIDIISLWTLPAILLLILGWAVIKKVPIYEAFIEGAKDGVKVSVNIIPYLVAIIVAISMFRASGAIELLTSHLKTILNVLKIPADILPLTIVRSLSGSAALGVFSDIVKANGVESYPAKLGAIMLGSSETTFYVLAVYFGAVGIKKYRYALLAGLMADFVGIVGAIIVARWFFL